MPVQTVFSPVRIWFVAVALVAASAMLAMVEPSQAQSRPVCPGPGGDPFPAYGRVGAAPNVAVWNQAVSALNCTGISTRGSKLTIAIAGRFRHSGSLSDLARRLGAISKTSGLKYWSTTDGNWRVLVSDAHALSSADDGARRGDFSAAEVFSGRKLHFAQDDTRSTGMNIYEVRVLKADSDRMVFAMTNVSPIRLAIVELFKAESLKSLHILERERGDVWRYFALSVVTDWFMGGHQASYINRQDAFYRYLAGRGTGAWPPLAR